MLERLCDLRHPTPEIRIRILVLVAALKALAVRLTSPPHCCLIFEEFDPTILAIRVLLSVTVPTPPSAHRMTLWLADAQSNLLPLWLAHLIHLLIHLWSFPGDGVSIAMGWYGAVTTAFCTVRSHVVFGAAKKTGLN